MTDLERINEMFRSASEIYEERVAAANIALTEAITKSYEVMYDKMMTEAGGEPFEVKIKKFVANMIAAITQFIQSTKVAIQTSLETGQFQRNLRKLHTELKDKKEQGVTQVQVQDIWALKNVYTSGVKELTSYAKKFASMQYKSTEALNDDLEKFNAVYDKVEKEAEEAIAKKKTVSVDNMIAFVDAECSGNGSVIKTLESAMREFREMGVAAEALAKKADILGPDIIEKHVGFIKKKMIQIGAFIKKWITKFVVACCIIIG